MTPLKTLTVCVLSLTCMATAYAQSSGVIVNVNAGGGRLNSYNGNKLEITSPVTQTGTLTNMSKGNNKFVGGVGIGYDFMVAPTANDANSPYLLRDISVIINAYYMQGDRDGNLNVTGYTQPTYRYNSTIKSGRLMADTEWNFHPIWPLVIPFAQGGIGVARNTMNLNTKPISGVTNLGRVSLDNHSQFQFAWEAGGGIKIPVNDHLQLSARYLYVGLGSVESGKADSNDGFTLAKPFTANLTSQEILGGISVIF